MRRRDHQSGFSTSVILLAVLVVAALAVTGLVVYQHHKPSSTKSSAATGTNQTTTQPKSTTTTQPATTTTQYLTITEWGVRMTLNSNTSSLYYYISPQNPNVAYLSLKTISDNAPLCAADKTSLAAIYRLTSTEHQNDLNNPTTANVAGTLQVGNYWYGYSTSHTNCYSSTAEMQAVAKVQGAYNLEDNFKTLAVVPSTN
jgi:preprotein translocase subunit SecG